MQQHAFALEARPRGVGSLRLAPARRTPGDFQPRLLDIGSNGTWSVVFLLVCALFINMGESWTEGIRSSVAEPKCIVLMQEVSTMNHT